MKLEIENGFRISEYLLRVIECFERWSSIDYRNRLTIIDQRPTHERQYSGEDDWVGTRGRPLTHEKIELPFNFTLEYDQR